MVLFRAMLLTSYKQWSSACKLGDGFQWSARCSGCVCNKYLKHCRKINRVKRWIAFQKPVNILLPGSLKGPWFTLLSWCESSKYFHLNRASSRPTKNMVQRLSMKKYTFFPEISVEIKLFAYSITCALFAFYLLNHFTYLHPHLIKLKWVNFCCLTFSWSCLSHTSIHLHNLSVYRIIVLRSFCYATFGIVFPLKLIITNI